MGMAGGGCGGDRADSSQTKPCNYTCLQREEAQPDFNVWLQPQDRGLSREKVAGGTREAHQAENKLVAEPQRVPGNSELQANSLGARRTPSFYSAPPLQLGNGLAFGTTEKTCGDGHRPKHMEHALREVSQRRRRTLELRPNAEGAAREEGRAPGCEGRSVFIRANSLRDTPPPPRGSAIPNAPPSRARRGLLPEQAPTPPWLPVAPQQPDPA